MICADEAVVSVLQVRFKGDHRLLGHVSNLLHQVTSVLSFSHKVLQDGREELFRALLVILKLVSWSLVFLGVFI